MGFRGLGFWVVGLGYRVLINHRDFRGYRV